MLKGLTAFAVGTTAIGALLISHLPEDQPAPRPAPSPASSWVPVPQELGDALAEGDDTPPENAATRDWEACSMLIADTTLIVCPDGFTTTS
jgi:hypothetical protein